MSELLTTQQLLDLLKVDRTTIYRMLKEGRLVGVKVGNQWRFQQTEIDRLLAMNHASSPHQPLTAAGLNNTKTPVIPTDCVQIIQNIFADMAEVGVMAISPDGKPLTQISHCSRFCQMILDSDTGERACFAAWSQFANKRPPEIATCHAGLHYACAPLKINGRVEGMLLAGQFISATPAPLMLQRRIAQLAQNHNLDEAALARAAAELPVLAARKLQWIRGWLEKLAASIDQISCERADLVSRLRAISEMTQIPLD